LSPRAPLARGHLAGSRWMVECATVALTYVAREETERAYRLGDALTKRRGEVYCATAPKLAADTIE
jgi:hypothetical protein